MGSTHPKTSLCRYQVSPHGCSRVVEDIPDQSNSPAYHAYALFVGCPEDIAIVGAERGGWILSFSRVMRLGVHSDPVTSRVPFHNISTSFPTPFKTHRFFHLISSLPLLVDLTFRVSGIDGDVLDFNAPRSLEPLTSPCSEGRDPPRVYC